MPPKRPILRRLARFVAFAAISLTLAALALWFLVIPRWAAPTEHPDAVTTAAERGADARRLRALGLRVPEGGIALERPFAAPWTSRSLVVPQSWRLPYLKAFLGRRIRVRADLLLADLDVLQAVMSRAYGGWDSAVARGWSWDRWFDDWRGDLRAAGARKLTLDEAFAPIDALLRFQRDNHTQIPLERLTLSVSQTAVLEAAPQVACTEVRASNGTFTIDAGDPAQAVRRALVARPDGALEPGAYVSAPSSRGELTAIHCGPAWIPLRVVSRGERGVLAHALIDEGFRTERPTIRKLSADVAYVRLPTMTLRNYAHVDQDRPSWPKPTGAEKTLVVDLRGNGGNAHDLGLYVLRDWIPRDRLPKGEPIGMKLATSCLFAPLKWGVADSGEGATKLVGGERADAQRHLDALFEPAPPDCPRTVRVLPASLRYADHHLDEHAPGPRIVVLVDNGCGSDCESLALFLASLPEAAVVGVNTFGVGQFVQPGSAVLPHTGLPFRMALGQSDIYGDARSFDGYGLDVDVVLPHPEDWTDAQLVPLADALSRR